MLMSVIGPDNAVHYRRPAGDQLLDEARRRPGYMVITQAEESMLLPAGKTCSECAHVHRCVAFGVVRSPESQRVCDWAPSRFQSSTGDARTG